jgi:hypothetical protein
MTHLTFKKGDSHTYEAIFKLNGDTYLFGIDGGYTYSSGYWGISIYRNGIMIESDGWDYSSKKTWVNSANSFVNELINK